jgi:NADP-dependent 3-hydroxy acid dehydrogenase YdfG
LNEVKAEIEKIGRHAHVYELDVRNINEIKALRNYVQKRIGKVDILVNNAGFTATKPAWQVT